jgi:hypothetical protein
MSYLLKKSLKIPYTALVAISPISWGIVCTAFGYFLILARANFEVTGTKTIFILSTPAYMLIAAVLSIVKYGGFGLLKTKKEKKKWDVLNNNINAQGHIFLSVSGKTLRDIYQSLSKLPSEGSLTSILYGGLVLVSALITEWLVSGKTTNLLAILIGGSTALLLLVLFIDFFAQRYISSTLRECKTLLMKRDQEVEKVHLKYNNLKTKFRFFLLIPILSVLVILTIISGFNLEIIILSLIGLAMATMVSQQLLASIYDVFQGIKKFASDLPKIEKSFFSTGSLDPEIIALYESLNKAAEQVYISKRKVERARQESKKRVEEIERWYNLIIGRKEKMAELKKELKELKEKVKNKKK